MSEIQLSHIVNTLTKTITKIIIKNVLVNLYSSATCFVEIYYTENGVDKLFDAKFVELTPEQYNSWGAGPDSDLYFEDCILTNLGYTRAAQ